MKHKSAKLGTALLVIAVILFWLRLWWPAFGALCAVGVIDMVLVVKAKGTISMWIWGRFRPWADAAWMLAVVAVTTAVLGPVLGLATLVGVIVGHLGWQSSEQTAEREQHD